ncbi:MAG: lysine exporter LysO family protein [Synergistetes bacterium]|nr:lysine exporter LysO family protein [Synergistota bacterium]MCX8127601.1 lysine exporter LysO family protein [Synergistota bacterium]MDW8191482.1 LysO family transporter [Synergistota bacterium]
MDIFLFALTLSLGILVGRKSLAPSWIMDKSDKALSLVIYILIFLIGMEIGSYREVIYSLGSIGLKSITIALFSTFFSAYLSKLLSERKIEIGP